MAEEVKKEYPNTRYRFYLDSGYVSGVADEIYTAEELGIYIGISDEEKEKILQEAFRDFIGNLDSGWYELEDGEDE